MPEMAARTFRFSTPERKIPLASSLLQEAHVIEFISPFKTKAICWLNLAGKKCLKLTNRLLVRNLNINL
jgi:hypothetical protein